MELSSLYTRRLSGSYSSRNSFNEDALEQLEFNINDISRASSPASVTSVSARSEGFRERRHRSSGRNEDEYRRRYSKVRGELEQEKVRGRILQQEKEEEIRIVKEALENERKLALISLQNRLEEEKKRELARLKEELIKQKDFELHQVLMYKESEKKSQNPHRPDDKAEKPKQKMEALNSEKDRNEVDEDDEASGGRDGDNDVAVLSERGRAKDQAREEGRRHKSVAERKAADEEIKSADAGTPHVQKRSNRTPRSHRSVDGYEGDKESHGGHRRRGHNSKTTDRADHGDPSVVADKAEAVETAARDNTRFKTVKASHVDGLPSTKHGMTRTIEPDPKPGTAEASLKEDAEAALSKESTASSSPEKANKENEVTKKENENGKTLEMEDKIRDLESERSSLLKRNEDIQRSLEKKIEEHKIREEEFMSLKAGYDRELRTVINEHKKVALGNLEKLKQAETALKQATISDEEIALLTQRHEQRRLSTTSLPGLPEEN